MAKQVIKFYSNGCGPCNQYAPTFKTVKQDLQGIIEFTEIDVDDDPQAISTQYKVKSIPHTVLLEDGKVVKTLSGRVSEQALRDFILI